MTSYVENVKRNVAGQGSVRQLGDQNSQNYRQLHGSSHTTTKHLDDRTTPSPPPSLPPPPMSLLNTNTLSYTLARTHLNTHPPQVNTSSAVSTMNTNPYNPTQFLSPDRYTRSRKGSAGSSISSSPSTTSLSPPPSHWSCSGCSGEMFPGEIAIFAERAGHNKCWHTTCVSCTKCGEMLEDLLYFHKNCQLFCGRDFAQLMNIPRCSACDELIFSSQYTLAEDRLWHEEHFCCWICDLQLAGHAYIPVGGQPHCMACWQERHGKVCSVCAQYIDPQGQRVSLPGREPLACQPCMFQVWSVSD